MRSIVKLFAAGVLSAILIGPSHAAPQPVGTWLVGNGKFTVRIAPCGSALCGTLVKLAKPLDKHGRIKIDSHNPNPALRKRPLIGIRVLNNMKPAGNGKWKASIYNADDGFTYPSTMKFSGGLLKVKACVLFACKSMDFRRVD